MAQVDAGSAANAPAAGAGPAITLRQAMRWNGCGFGFQQPILVATLGIVADPDLAFRATRVRSIVSRHLALPQDTPEVPDSALPAAQAHIVGTLLHMVEALFVAADQPVEAAGRIIGQLEVAPDRASQAWLVRLAIPALSPAMAELALAWSATLVNRILDDPQPDTATLMAELGSLVQTIGKAGPSQAATKRLVKASLSLGIPFQILPQSVVQLGWGARARLIDAGCNDETSLIGARLAKDKLATASLLRSCGIPTPEHRYVANVEAAMETARQLGWPVVVKPVDQDRGEGATADVRTEDELRKAFVRATEKSPQVMVEKHVAGREFRLMVIDGQLFWAFERVPARVIGDGRASVAELVSRVNEERAGNAEGRQLLRPIPIGPDMHDQLRRANMDLDSIPDRGQVVRLQSVPRVAGGGQVVPAFDDLHPDNAAIAVRAARLLRLNIAGIDYLTTDPTKSWRETGGRIIEVNANPQYSSLSKPDIYDAFLKRLIKDDCRLPVILCVGNTAALRSGLENQLARTRLRVGFVAANRYSVPRNATDVATSSLSECARMATRDPDVDLIVALCSLHDLLHDGLPFDRIALLALCAQSAPDGQASVLRSLVQAHLAGPVMALESESEAHAAWQGHENRSAKRAANEARMAQAIRREIAARALPKGLQGLS